MNKGSKNSGTASFVIDGKRYDLKCEDIIYPSNCVVKEFGDIGRVSYSLDVDGSGIKYSDMPDLIGTATKVTMRDESIRYLRVRWIRSVDYGSETIITIGLSL